MVDLNKLKVAHVYYNLTFGFFDVWFVDDRSLQCCLVADDDGNYIPAISRSDNGYYWGICGDNNAWAANGQEWGHINDFLIAQAEKAGLEIVA